MIWNLGSINADNFYHLKHLPAAGETLQAARFHQGLGGKGANMSVAAARAAARVAHVGAVGADGKWAIDRLLEYGVDTPYIATVDAPTGHANIYVDAQGENNIVLLAGANADVSEQMIGRALSDASAGDMLLMQNETSGQVYAAKTAKALGLKVTYAAAPFSADAVNDVMAFVDLLILNAVEADQLERSQDMDLSQVPIDDIVVTLGAEGCQWVSNKQHSAVTLDAYPTHVVDTTGAGDTFTGYLVAALDRGMGMSAAIDLGLQAAALMVAREGTADVIPDLKEIQDHDFS